MVPKTKLEGHLLSASTCIEGPTYFTRSPGVEYKKLSKKKKKKKKRILQEMNAIESIFYLLKHFMTKFTTKNLLIIKQTTTAPK